MYVLAFNLVYKARGRDVKGVLGNRCIMCKCSSLGSYWLPGNGYGTLIHVNFQMEVYGHAME
jgi:hypothetical protein